MTKTNDAISLHIQHLDVLVLTTFKLLDLQQYQQYQWLNMRYILYVGTKI